MMLVPGGRELGATATLDSVASSLITFLSFDLS